MESLNKSKKGKLIIENLKNDYFLQILLFDISKKKSLEIFKLNKKIQKRLNISIKDYKVYSGKYSSIEIEVLPDKNKYGQFININEEDKLNYHIYFNNDNEEIKRNYFTENDLIKKINIIINYQVKTFEYLFYNCECIE